MMFRNAALFLLLASPAAAFLAPSTSSTKTTTSSLNIVQDEDTAVMDKVKEVWSTTTKKKRIAGNTAEFDSIVTSRFPGAITNLELETKVIQKLVDNGFSSENTLLATSLCADEVARVLEDDFVKVFGNNFNLGGLSGFPFAGNTGFGAMSGHIPDGGKCLVIYGPHVGVAKDGTVGKVERAGIELIDTCCGSAIAASNYLKGITDGGAKITMSLQQFTDFQQGAVQELILPHGKRLADAENRMIELPYAIYESQDILMGDIIDAGCAGIKEGGLALLGGIQINTAPDTMDYFHPLRFDYMDSDGNIVEDWLPTLTQ
mmetsp:Transcript_4126/g.8523  ORF Transcript_4126/g.8523 Transcript_4126/m.8523 type:complete len:317 (+) Transcript_4126:461-1411(+)|eukprot:CAMPEP_0168761058 /NCGR_PEP_ID=MMETSP0724-20121128/23097_1 /TAXON_ID=265536 /ORGANISM="Amphiprora sp., Strain CCMP467" /LENGTH=316 /DNA_ID=CAMNT_0008810109 /DNA_START=294 /DNA_END=1244 /DNA_ORIENTATION=-